MTKKLAIIGASYLQLPLVQKAKEMGVESYCFAWEEGAVCKEICDHFYPVSTVDKEEILRICREIGIDGVVTIASDIAVLTVNYVAEQMGLIGNPDAYSRTATNKYLMRQCFLEHDVPSPLFCQVDHINATIPSTFTYPVVVKPTDRSGSRGVGKVNAQSELNAAVERALKESFQQKAVIEEFVEGREISVESISYEGVHYILQVTDKVTTEEPYFVEIEHHQPSTLPEDINARVKNIVLKALSALHIQYGAAHAELIITANGEIKVIEIGARMGGDFIGSDLVELSTGYDFLKGVINVALGQFEVPLLTSNKCSGVYFLSKETEHILPIIQNADQYLQIVRAKVTNETLKHIACSADRSGYLIYQSDSKFSMEQLRPNSQKIKILVLASGNGGTMKFVHHAIQVLNLDAGIIAVLSDRPCGAIDFAKKKDIPHIIFSPWKENTNEIVDAIMTHSPDIVITNIHKILSEDILTCCEAKFINLHYSLLPAFGGVIGFKTLEMAREANTKVIGATCHYVTNKVDAGKVISQAAIPVDWADDFDLIGNKIFRIACETILNGILIINNMKIGESSPNGVLYSPKLVYDNSRFTESFWNLISNL